MNFEDSRNAIYCDPNAFIQKQAPKEECKRKKIVFQQPYESMPAFYINNNFKKRDCDCVPNLKQKQPEKQHQSCFCDHCKQNWKDPNENRDEKYEGEIHKGNYHHDKSHNNARPVKGFDIKSLLPLLGMFNKGGGDLSSVVGLLNNKNIETSSGGVMNLISSMLSNKDAMSGILNLFSGQKGSSVKSNKTNKSIKSTDFEIKNYTRVE